MKKGDVIEQYIVLQKLVSSLYSRTNNEITKGTFKVKGKVVDIYLAHNEIIYRISLGK